MQLAMITIPRLLSWLQTVMWNQPILRIHNLTIASQSRRVDISRESSILSSNHCISSSRHSWSQLLLSIIRVRVDSSLLLGIYVEELALKPITTCRARSHLSSPELIVKIVYDHHPLTHQTFADILIVIATATKRWPLPSAGSSTRCRLSRDWFRIRSSLSRNKLDTSCRGKSSRTCSCSRNTMASMRLYSDECSARERRRTWHVGGSNRGDSYTRARRWKLASRGCLRRVKCTNSARWLGTWCRSRRWISPIADTWRRRGIWRSRRSWHIGCHLLRISIIRI